MSQCTDGQKLSLWFIDLKQQRNLLFFFQEKMAQTLTNADLLFEILSVWKLLQLLNLKRLHLKLYKVTTIYNKFMLSNNSVFSSDAKRGPFLPVCFAVLSEDVSEYFGHAVYSQFPPDGKRLQKLNGSSFSQKRLEGKGDTSEILRSGDFIKLATILQGEFLSIIHAYLSETVFHFLVCFKYTVR